LARTVAGKDYVVLMADIFGLGYGDKPKTPQDLMAGMRAVHDDLAFTIGCGGKAYDTLHGAAGRGRDSLKLHDRWVGKQILRLARASRHRSRYPERPRGVEVDHQSADFRIPLRRQGVTAKSGRG
jgi:hypothetical protein